MVFMPPSDSIRPRYLQIFLDKSTCDSRYNVFVTFFSFIKLQKLHAVLQTSENLYDNTCVVVPESDGKRGDIILH